MDIVKIYKKEYYINLVKIKGKQVIRMVKLRKYIKPYISSMLIVVVLLFTQAMCELKMPDYMSDIVNVGINSNGIKDGVFEASKADEVDKLKLFMDDSEAEVFDKHYKLVKSDEATENEVNKYPALKDDDIYVLNKVNKEEREELKEATYIAETIVMGIRQSEGEEAFDALMYMPEEQIAAIKDEALNRAEAMGKSTTDAVNARYVYDGYVSIGMNVEKIQYGYLFTKGIYMLLVALASAISALMVGFIASRVAAGFGRDLRHDVFHKVTSFSNGEFNKFSTNTLITRNISDIQQTQLVIVMFLRIIIYAPIIGIGAILKVIDSNADMTWIIALVIGIILCVMAVAFATVMPKFKILQKLMDNLNGVVREMLDGMPVIRAFNNEDRAEKKFDDANTKIMKTNLFTSRMMSAMMPIVMFVMNSATILIVWVGSHEIDNGVIQIGDMMAFMQYAMQIIMAFMMITMVSIMLPRASVAAGRVAEVLSTEPSVKDPEKEKEFKKDKKGTVEFKNVSFKYPDAGDNVLSNISFTAEPGKTTAFIGSTGSGKSTLINLVPRFFDATEGEVIVDGVNVKDISQHKLRDKIGYVPQKGILFSGTIESNLKYADENATDDDIKEAARIAQALEFIEEKDEKFESPITQMGVNVSGGQRQRLSIARALVKHPDIFIFDDTFSALDFKTDAALRKELGVLCKKTGSTVLIVAQRIASILHADKIIVLDEGRVAGIGTHKELLKTCDVYKEIAYSQLSKEELENE